MDPSRPESFNHKTELLSTGRVYHFVDQVPKEYHKQRNPTLLCIHGFPDLWYGWRYQIGPWTRRGYRVVVPDMLGYGGSSNPKDAIEYSTKRLCADLTALLDLLKIDKVIVIGHDWGSFIAARFALWHPRRLLALVLLSVPYTPPSPKYLPLETVVQKAPNLGYQLYFENPKSSSEILKHLRKVLGLIFTLPGSNRSYDQVGALEDFLLNQPGDPLPTIFSNQEFNYYLAQLSQDMHGPLNYYRTSKIRHEEELAAKLPASLSDDLPVLFLWGTKDITTTEFLIAKARKFIKRFQDIALEGRGHWLMVEAKDEIAERIPKWLEGLMCSRPEGYANL